MRPTQLLRLLTSLSAAADVVDTIDDPARGESRGWDLAGWGYELVPWGVCFTRSDEPDGVSVLAASVPAGWLVALIEARPAGDTGSAILAG